MTTWVLIVFVGIGALSERESNALTMVPGFTSKVACEAAGTAAVAVLDAKSKMAQTVCVEVK